MSIEKYLEKLVVSIEFLFKQLEATGLKDSLEKVPVGLFDLNFQFNIRVRNGKTKDEFAVYLSKDASKLMKGYSAALGFSIIGTEATWLEIFQGKKSIMGHYNEGNLKISNIRINWLKMTLLSNLVANLISLKLLKI